MDEILNVYEKFHLEPPWSQVVVFAFDVFVVLMVLWCVREVREARRAARQAKRIESSNLQLYEGARFIAGTVELAEGANTAIRVTITQEGKEFESNNRHRHTWTEIHREVEAVPFYVRRENGERIRVEPPVDVMLIDRLDQMEWFDSLRRRRRAELVTGERAVIEGFLQRAQDPEARGAGSAYRDGPPLGWIMKPTRKRGMFVSAENLSHRHELRAKAYLRTAIFVGVVGALAASAVIPYRIRVALGRNVEGDYEGKQFYQTRNSKGHLFDHHVAQVNYRDEYDRSYGRRWEVSRRDYLRLPEKGRMWVRHVPSMPWATAIGKSSSVHGPYLLLMAFLASLGIARIVMTHRHRRWYEGQLVESGNGMLPAPTNARFPERSASPPRASP